MTFFNKSFFYIYFCMIIKYKENIRLLTFFNKGNYVIIFIIFYIFKYIQIKWIIILYIKYENLSDYENLWMIIHIDVYLFVTPYKREIPLMKIHMVLFLPNFSLRAFYYLFLIFLLLSLYFTTRY